MKKICFYIGSMQKGGAQRVISNLCNFFIKKGEVILINDIEPVVNIPEYDIHRNVKRYYLDDKQRCSISKNIFRMSKLRKILKNEQPELVVSFMGPPNIRLLLSTCSLKFKKVVSVRNDPNIEYGYGIKKIVSNIIFLLADGIVFQTKEAASYFWRANRQKSQIIYNPVNEKFFMQNRNHIKNEIAIVGRLEPQKNIALAIRAFSKVVKAYPNYKLVLYGEGKEKQVLVDLVKQLGLESSVIFYGIANEIERKLAESALFLMSSDYEGLPNALMEAMAVGVPVVATNCPCGGPKELIQNENQGLLVSCNDVEGMYQAIHSILSNDEKRNRLSVETKKRAMQFETNIIFEQWYNYLFSL